MLFKIPRIQLAAGHHIAIIAPPHQPRPPQTKKEFFVWAGLALYHPQKARL
jgi:hypothetical protein